MADKNKLIICFLPIFLISLLPFWILIELLTKVIITILLAVISSVMLRTLIIGYTHYKPVYAVGNDSEDIDLCEKKITRFQEALKFETISTEPEEFLKMIEFIRTNFKTIHKSKYVTMETVSDYSLLYTVAGSKKSLTPYLLLAHIDVTPAESTSWILPPFGGKIKKGFIYSRGAMDFKNGVMGILEALEHLLLKGYKPKRTFYIAIMHDDTDKKYDGANAISKLLEKKRVRKLEFVLGPGSTVTGDVSGIAMIGVTEKSVLDLTLTVKGIGGHTAFRFQPTPYGVLAKAISKLEQQPHPSMLGHGPEKDMLEMLAPTMNLWYKIQWSNIWLYKYLISKEFSNNATMNAMLRTIHTVVDIQSDTEMATDNKIPECIKANITVHVHPNQTVNDVVTFFRNTINDRRVGISTVSRGHIASVSPHGMNDFGYQTIYRSIYQVFNPVIIAPNILPTETSSTKFHMFTNNIYRFTPTVILQGDELRYHGKNEKLSIKNYGQTINFYKNIIINADKSSL